MRRLPDALAFNFGTSAGKQARARSHFPIAIARLPSRDRLPPADRRPQKRRGPSSSRPGGPSEDRRAARFSADDARPCSPRVCDGGFIRPGVHLKGRTAGAVSSRAHRSERISPCAASDSEQHRVSRHRKCRQGELKARHTPTLAAIYTQRRTFLLPLRSRPLAEHLYSWWEYEFSDIRALYQISRDRCFRKEPGAF